MFAQLVPPPPSPTPTHDDPPAGDQQTNDSLLSLHESQAALAAGNGKVQVPPTSRSSAGRSNALRSAGGDPPVDNDSTASTKRTRGQMKRNYQDLDPESSEEDRQAPGLPNAKKPKHPKSRATPRRTKTPRDLALQRPPLPVMIGSQYMKVDVIDLTKIEVNRHTHPTVLRTHV